SPARSAAQAWAGTLSTGAARLGNNQWQMRCAMEQRFRPSVVVLVAVVALLVPAVAQAQDAWIGTWKLNLAKSKYDPANLAPKSQTLKQDAVAGGGFKGTTDGVDAQGKPTHTEQATMFDGKASEIKGAPDANTTRVYKRI